ncbi:MAG: glycosyltransferase [Burkholderiales bacterium]|nr:glycosyltransferase [Burkholderiales bacterium]
MYKNSADISSREVPFVTVIVAVYNGAATLKQCIDSVASQTFRDIELIVVDGGSTDGTVGLLVANASKLSYWISEPDKGIYDAWNKGLQHATGDWILFLGSDDYLYDERVLESMVPHLETLPSNIRIAYGQVLIVNKTGHALYAIGAPWHTIKKRFRQVMCIPHTGTLHHRTLFDQHGNFDSSYRIAGDYEFLLRELKQADASFIENNIVAAMRVGGVGSDPSNGIRVMRETRRAARVHGRLFPGRYWLMAVMSIYFRAVLWDFLGDRQSRRLLDFARRVFKGKPAYWTKT